MSDGDEETRRAIYENVASGRIEIAGEEDGEHVFRVTDEGQKRVNEILDGVLDAHPELDGIAAADALAVQLDLPFRMAAELLEIRRRQRAANSHSGSDE